MGKNKEELSSHTKNSDNIHLRHNKKRLIRLVSMLFYSINSKTLKIVRIYLQNYKIGKKKKRD